MYSRSINGRTLTFGVSGKLWKNALVMYDRETRTLWSHLTGEAIEGPLAGEKLTMLASVPKIKWSVWKAQYPHTRVLSVNGREDLLRDSYKEYHTSSRTGLFDPENADRRLRTKDMVIGVQAEKFQKAYPLKKKYWKTSSKKDAPYLIQDQIGNIPVAVFYNPETYATAVYDRRLKDGTVLTFTTDITSYLVTDHLGRQWHLLTGQDSNGNALVSIPHIRVYWFAWADFYPQTLLYDKKE